MRTRVALCAIAATLVLAGCGGSSSKSSSGTNAAAQTSQHRTVIKGIVDHFDKPTSAPAHPGAKVDELIVKDVVKGKGDVLHAGDTGLFDFIVANYQTGRLIDTSWRRRGRPFQIAVDHNVVIDGWWQGLPGMRVGGRRTLVVPPSLGFVSSPNPKVAGKTTYFDVVLLAVIPAQAAGTGQQQSQGGGASGQ